ncbi:MAG: hypothetical protein LBD36_02285 [Holosporales bacterium]|jgi:DNA polymerase III delta prime subunit|nr:hypothetical protein [Holosporales bacterium]
MKDCKLLNNLISNYNENRLAPVYLFYGDYQHSAQILAEHILATSLTYDKEMTKLHIKNGTHPNFFFVTPHDKEITVDIVRKMTSFLQDTPIIAGWRVVIIHPANTMNVSASNAILKSMEEIPDKTVMILVADNIYNITATVLSRCQKIFFPYKTTAIESYIKENNSWINEVLKVFEKTIETQQLPNKDAINSLVDKVNIDTLHEVVKYFITQNIFQNLNTAHIWLGKYDKITNFANEALGKSLSPAHFITAIFALLL